MQRQPEIVLISGVESGTTIAHGLTTLAGYISAASEAQLASSYFIPSVTYSESNYFRRIKVTRK